MLAVSVTWPGTALAQPAWVPNDIGTLGADAVARAVNNHGVVVGDSLLPGNRARHLFLWTVGGGMVDTGTMGGFNAFGNDINDVGHVAGSGDLAGGGPLHAFFWSAATGFIDICEGEAYALNNAGTVVGQCRGVAMLWSAATGVVLLGTVPGILNGSYWATDINDAGTVVGVVFTTAHIEDMTYRPFVRTPAGSMSLVDPDVRLAPGASVQINNRGDIAADGFVWLHGGQPPVGAVARSNRINNKGQVVGSTMVWSADRGTIDLGSVFGVAAGALGINDAGLVVGWARDVTDVLHAVVWRPREDLAIDFGPMYGLWLRTGGTYANLHALSPVAVVAGDLDGSGTDDLIVDFGSGVGVWAWMNRTEWRWIHSTSPRRMLAVDLDGDLRDELVCVFQGAGLWAWRQGAWTFLHHLEPTALAVAQLDGPGRKDLVVNFAGYGLYSWQNDAGWIGIHTTEASTLLGADLDGNGQDDLVIDFLGAGLWVRFDNGAWLELGSPRASRIAAGDIDGNGVTDLVVDFGPGPGIWTYRTGAGWSQLHPLSAESVTVADLDGTGTDEIVIDFGPSYGLWQYANASEWRAIHGLSPDLVTSATLH